MKKRSYWDTLYQNFEGEEVERLRLCLKRELGIALDELLDNDGVEYFQQNRFLVIGGVFVKKLVKKLVG